MNENFPLCEYGHVVWFLLNRYDPNVRIVDIDHYCLKVEHDQQIKQLKGENQQLKDELKTYKNRTANRFRRMEIIYEIKRRRDMKKLYHQLYDKIKMELKQEQEDILNKVNIQKESTSTTKIENCTLTNCRIITNKENNKTKKRKYTTLLDNDDERNNKEKERQISSITDQIMKRIIALLDDENLRENFASCLERKPKYWECGGFVCCTNVNNNNDHTNENKDPDNQETKKFIFLKKGNDKWIQFLQTIGCEKIENERMDANFLQSIKEQLVCKSKRVRLDGIQNKNKVNKRQFILLSTSSKSI